MKKKSNKLIWITIVLLIIFGMMLYFYLKPSDNKLDDITSNIREIVVETGNIEKSITGSRRNIIQFNRKTRIKHI